MLLVHRAVGIDDISSVDFKVVMDKWLLGASYPCFWNEKVYFSYPVSISPLCWLTVGEERRHLFGFYSYISEVKVLDPKNCVWRNLFSSWLNVDKDILVLKAGPDAVIAWDFGERGKCILPEGRDCGQRAGYVFPQLVTKIFFIPPASLQYDFSLTLLIIKSISPLAGTWLSIPGPCLTNRIQQKLLQFLSSPIRSQWPYTKAHYPKATLLWGSPNQPCGVRASMWRNP